jgi:hypothetical protein
MSESGGSYEIYGSDVMAVNGTSDRNGFRRFFWKFSQQTDRRLAFQRLTRGPDCRVYQS